MITNFFSTLKQPKIVVIDSNDDKLKAFAASEKIRFSEKQSRSWNAQWNLPFG